MGLRGAGGGYALEEGGNRSLPVGASSGFGIKNPCKVRSADRQAPVSPFLQGWVFLELQEMMELRETVKLRETMELCE